MLSSSKTSTLVPPSSTVAVPESEVTNHLMSRLVDPGSLIFSTDYSYITCAECRQLLTLEG